MTTITLFGQQENIEKTKEQNSATKKISAILKLTKLKPNQFEDLRRRFEDKERVKTNKKA
jgi:hypothetical protein